MTGGAAWQIWADTGGTFTDCLAVDPRGEVQRIKVLSSSALRGRVRAAPEPLTLELAAAFPEVPADFFVGFAVRFPGYPEAGDFAVRASRPGGLCLTVDRPLPSGLAGALVELASPEEAPVLAARLATGTPPGHSLPPLALRLATTRGTNALLEGKGAAVAFFVTAGFADLLTIGDQQRPDLFALAIEKPTPLYRRVIEVRERLAADGSVLLPVDLAALRAPAEEALAAGCEAAAVALLHSYRNPVHEEAVGELLAALGFRHVALSRCLAPLIKLLPRAETAVVDAALGPILERYLDGVEAALEAGGKRPPGAREGGGSLHVMTSAGGLVPRAAFRAKDSLLSGPAGGVVGAARAGRRSGLHRLIAFDMGGTSTDVSRFDGDYEYVFEHRVGNARLVAPALAIESVAAGGGSICAYGPRGLTVGPESAGAHPGPACYGAGGPLTLTDVNLLLGRLEPSAFEIPLSVAAAEEAFAALLARIPGGGEREPLLAGLLALADETMAEAIRSISLRRGYDPAAYALVAFGGAGGQHAAAVAELLGMRTILVPADAGLLSARGLGAAVLERFRERQVLAPLAEVAGDWPAWLAELERQAIADVAAEGVPLPAIEIRRRLLSLRFVGQETALPVELEESRPPEDAFLAAYREIYGYTPEGRPLELESLRAVASSRPEPELPPGDLPAPVAVELTATRRCFLGGAFREVSVTSRDRLPPGAVLAGPALVLESHTATVVPPGWTARIDGVGGLVMERWP